MLVPERVTVVSVADDKLRARESERARSVEDVPCPRVGRKINDTPR